MGRKISSQKFDFLKKELSFHKEKGNLTEEQLKDITKEYEINKLSFMKVILTIGAVLIGLGILSFIASNWQAMGRVLKLSLIIFSYLGINILSYRLEESYSKVAESLLLVGVAIYGAGIFLIGQMFHFGGHFTSAFLLWAIGILPMAYLLKDKLIYIFSIALSFIYINGHFSMDSFPIISLILVGLFYYINYKKFENFSIALFLINILALNTIALFIETTRLVSIDDYFGVIIFIIGLGMYYAPVLKNRYIIKLQGSLVFGIAGLGLTFHSAWRFLEGEFYTGDIARITAVIFAIIYVVFLLYLVRQENLIALTFVCITIFRYYVDTMYDFMPKSLFFLTSGLIFLAFGYYIERKRRKTGGIINE